MPAVAGHGELLHQAAVGQVEVGDLDPRAVVVGDEELAERGLGRGVGERDARPVLARVGVVRAERRPRRRRRRRRRPASPSARRRKCTTPSPVPYMTRCAAGAPPLITIEVLTLSSAARPRPHRLQRHRAGVDGLVAGAAGVPAEPGQWPAEADGAGHATRAHREQGDADEARSGGRTSSGPSSGASAKGCGDSRGPWTKGPTHSTGPPPSLRRSASRPHESVRVELEAYERRFRRAGLPLFIEDYTATGTLHPRGAAARPRVPRRDARRDRPRLVAARRTSAPPSAGWRSCCRGFGLAQPARAAGRSSPRPQRIGRTRARPLRAPPRSLPLDLRRAAGRRG